MFWITFELISKMFSVRTPFRARHGCGISVNYNQIKNKIPYRKIATVSYSM